MPAKIVFAFMLINYIWCTFLVLFYDVGGYLGLHYDGTQIIPEASKEHFVYILSSVRPVCVKDNFMSCCLYTKSTWTPSSWLWRNTHLFPDLLAIRLEEQSQRSYLVWWGQGSVASEQQRSGERTSLIAQHMIILVQFLVIFGSMFSWSKIYVSYGTCLLLRLKYLSDHNWESFVQL